MERQHRARYSGEVPCKQRKARVWRSHDWEITRPGRKVDWKSKYCPSLWTRLWYRHPRLGRNTVSRVRISGSSVGYISYVHWAYDYLGPFGVLWVYMAELGRRMTECDWRCTLRPNMLLQRMHRWPSRGSIQSCTVAALLLHLKSSRSCSVLSSSSLFYIISNTFRN